MANDADIERARAGRNAWNLWANERIQAGEMPTIDFSGAPLEIEDFKAFIFPGPVKFADVQFVRSISFKNAEFRRDVDFMRTKFKCDVDFTEAKFLKRARFSEARFYGLAQFRKAHFSGRLHLDRIVFAKDAVFAFAIFGQLVYAPHNEFHSYANFKGAHFDSRLLFTNSRFDGESVFRGVKFKRANFYGVHFKHSLIKFVSSSFEKVPDLRASVFATPANFQGAKFPYAARPGLARLLAQAADRGDAAKYRRLKQIAAEAKDHEGELDFFAKEIRAKRFYETEGRWANAINIGYELLSDFGRSVARPLIWLVLLTVFSAVAILGEYWSASSIVLTLIGTGAALLLPFGKGIGRRPSFVVGLTVTALVGMFLAMHSETSIAAMKLSVTNAALLIGADKWSIRDSACEALYGCRKCMFGSFLPYVQSTASLLLLFLVGLGLRNRFRIGTS